MTEGVGRIAVGRLNITILMGLKGCLVDEGMIGGLDRVVGLAVLLLVWLCGWFDSIGVSWVNFSVS